MDEAVKYIGDDGVIHEKNLELIKNENGFVTAENDVRLLLPSSPEKGISLTYQDQNITLIPQLHKSVSQKTTQLEDNSVLYQNYLGDGISLRYTPTLTGVKEDIVLAAYSGISDFDFTLYTNGLHLYRNETGYFLAESENTAEHFQLGEIVAFDARGRFSLGSMTIQTIKEGQIYELTVHGDQDFLTDDKTIYPVTIDPTITISDNTYGANAIEDVGIYSGKPNINGNWLYLHAGYYDDTYQTGRVLFRLPGLIASAVYKNPASYNLTSVNFHLREASGTGPNTFLIYSNSGSTTWTESGATWNNAGAILGTQYAAASASYNSDTVFNITQLVKAWQNGTCSPSAGFILRSTSETSLDKAFYSSEADSSYRPYVEVNYNSNNVSLNYTTMDVDVGAAKTLVLSGISEPITWVSSDSSIASVSSTGVVQGIRIGVTTIAAYVNGYAPQYCTVYVTIADGIYYLKSGLGYYMGTAGTIADGTGVRLYPKATTGLPRIRQLWQITYSSSGYYNICPLHNLRMGMTSPTANPVIKHSNTENFSNRWSLTPENGQYVIKYQGSSGLKLMPAEGGTYPGMSVAVSPGSTNENMTRWTLEKENVPPAGIFLYDKTTGNIINDTQVSKTFAQNITYIPNQVETAVYGGSVTSQTVLWQSLAPSVLLIAGTTGVVTASSPGTATLVAYAGSLTASFTLRAEVDAVLMGLTEDNNQMDLYIPDVDQTFTELGYSTFTRPFDSVTPGYAIQLMKNGTFFYIMTHGYPEYMVLGNQNQLTVGNIAQADLSNLKLVLLLSCEVGLGYSEQNVINNTPTNMVEAFRCSGVETVIGFDEEISKASAEEFAKEFTRSLKYGYSVGSIISQLSGNTYYEQLLESVVAKGNLSLTLA